MLVVVFAFFPPQTISKIRYPPLSIQGHFLTESPCFYGGEIQGAEHREVMPKIGGKEIRTRVSLAPEPKLSPRFTGSPVSVRVGPAGMLTGLLTQKLRLIVSKHRLSLQSVDKYMVRAHFFSFMIRIMGNMGPRAHHTEPRICLKCPFPFTSLLFPFLSSPISRELLCLDFIQLSKTTNKNHTH